MWSWKEMIFMNVRLAGKFRGFFPGALSLKKGLKAASSSSTTTHDRSVGLHYRCRFKTSNNKLRPGSQCRGSRPEAFYISCSCFNV